MERKFGLSLGWDVWQEKPNLEVTCAHHLRCSCCAVGVLDVPDSYEPAMPELRLIVIMLSLSLDETSDKQKVFCFGCRWREFWALRRLPPPCLDLPPHVVWLCMLTNYFPTLSLQPEKAVPPPQSNNQRAREWWEITNSLHTMAGRCFGKKGVEAVGR